MPAQALHLRIVTESDEFQSLRDDWSRLWQSLAWPQVFLGFDWCWNAWNLVARHRGYDLCIVVGERNSEIVLILPLMRVDGVLRLLSSDTVEYRDAIVKSGEDAQAWLDQAWSYVASRVTADLFLLQNLREPNLLRRKLEASAGARTILVSRCPVIRLGRFAGWDDYAATLPRSLASDQRRQWRRIRERLPGIDFRLVTRAEDVGPMIDWVTRHKLRWAEERENTSVWFASDDKLRLLRSAVESNRAAGQLIFGVLGDGETIVSAGWGYVSGDEFLFYAFAYDAEYATYSPSRLFLERLIGHCIERRLRCFDFMPGGESYKRLWATDYVSEISLAGHLTPRGERLLRFAQWKHAAAAQVGTMRMYRLLPGPLRRLLQRRSRAFQLLDYVVTRGLASPGAPPGEQPASR